MTQIGMPQHDPIPIADIAKPSFARLPDPLAMFARRAGRLRSLADGNALRSYLTFLADLADIQHRLQDGLPEVAAIAADTMVRAGQFGMPPLDRSGFTRDRAFDEAWHRLLALADDIAMPESARLALARVKGAGAVAEAELIRASCRTRFQATRWPSTCSWLRFSRCISPGLRRNSTSMRSARLAREQCHMILSEVHKKW